MQSCACVDYPARSFPTHARSAPRADPSASGPHETPRSGRSVPAAESLFQISTPDQRSRPKACAESHHGVQIRIEFIARARRPRYAPAHPQLVRPRLRGAATLPQSVSDSDRCLTYISPPTGGNWLLTTWTISTHAALQPLRAIFCSSIGSATSLTPNEPITFRTVSNSGFAVSLKVL